MEFLLSGFISLSSLTQFNISSLKFLSHRYSPDFCHYNWKKRAILSVCIIPLQRLCFYHIHWCLLGLEFDSRSRSKERMWRYILRRISSALHYPGEALTGSSVKERLTTSSKNRKAASTDKQGLGKYRGSSTPASSDLLICPYPYFHKPTPSLINALTLTGDLMWLGNHLHCNSVTLKIKI